MLMIFAGASAQNCDVIMLPYFGGDADRMAEYPAEKLDWRCRYARAAFYESDTVPSFAYVYSIADVTNRATGENLTEDYVVDLSTLSYYGYNFNDLQLQYKSPRQVLCFRTPASAHPYLVLRSITDMFTIAGDVVETKQ